MLQWSQVVRAGWGLHAIRQGDLGLEGSGGHAELPGWAACPPLWPFTPSAFVTLNSFSDLWGYLSFFFLLSTGKNAASVETS